MDWCKLERRELEPPYMPRVVSVNASDFLNIKLLHNLTFYSYFNLFSLSVICTMFFYLFKYHPLDTHYFDKHFTKEKPRLTPVDKTILQSMDKSQFDGFTYTNPNVTDS